MTKPVITNRVTQGTALTYAQLDTNFTNLQDATFTLKAGTGGTDVVSELNGTVTLVAGSGVSITGNNTAKTVTIGYTESQNLFVNVVAGGTTLVADNTADSLTLTGGTGISITGNATTDTATFALANTAVTAASYTYASITVDAQGRITAASSGTAPVTSVSGTSGRITSTGGTTPVLDLVTTAVTAGSYTAANITIDAYGRITSATNGSTGSGTVTSVSGTGTVNGLTLTGTVTTTGNLTLGGTLSLVSPPAIGGTTPAAGTFTALTSTGLSSFTGLKETVYALTYASTLTPSALNGSVQRVTLTGNVIINAFTSPVAGQSVVLIIKQDATGGRTLTSTMKFAGSSKTLSTIANSIDVLSIFYDGTDYLCNLAKGYA